MRDKSISAQMVTNTVIRNSYLVIKRMRTIVNINIFCISQQYISAFHIIVSSREVPLSQNQNVIKTFLSSVKQHVCEVDASWKKMLE